MALKNSARLQGAPYGLDCSACPRLGSPCDTWGDDSTGYKYEGHDLLGQKWEACPSSYLRSHTLNRALELYRQGRVFGSLSGFPSEWAHWVAEYLTEIHEAIEAHKTEQINTEIGRG